MLEKKSGSKAIKYGLATLLLIGGAIGSIFTIPPIAVIGVSGIETARLTKKQLKIFMNKGSQDILEIIETIKDKFVDAIEELLGTIDETNVDDIKQLSFTPQTKKFLFSSYEDLNKSIKDELKQMKLDKKLNERLLLIVNYKNTFEIEEDIKYLMVEFMKNKLLSVLNYNKCSIKIADYTHKPTEITKTKKINSYTSLMNHLDWLFTSFVFFKIKGDKACYYINYFTDEITDKEVRQYKRKHKTDRISKEITCVKLADADEYPDNSIELNYTNYDSISEV